MIKNELSESMVSTAEVSVTFMNALLINQGFATAMLSNAMSYVMKMINPL